MKIINFMDQPAQFESRSVRIWYLTSLVISVIIFSVIGFIEIKQLWLYFKVKYDHDVICQYVNGQQAFIEKKKNLDITHKSLNTKLRTIDTENNLPDKILINIARCIPNNCKLININYKNNIIILKGYSKTTKDLTNFLGDLSNWGAPRNKKLIKARLTNIQQGTSGYLYEIKIDL